MKRLEPSLEAALAWAIIRQAIKRRGRAQQPELEPRAAIALTLTGFNSWALLCDQQTKNLDAIRREFMGFYDRVTPEWLAQVLPGLPCHSIGTLRIEIIDKREDVA